MSMKMGQINGKLLQGNQLLETFPDHPLHADAIHTPLSRSPRLTLCLALVTASDMHLGVYILT